MSDFKSTATSRAAMAAVRPRLREVHADPGHRSPQIADLPAALQKPAEEKSPAQWAYERLIMYISKFEETLNKDEEVAMGFAGGDAGVLRIEGIGFFDPDMITFYGRDEAGARTQLVQHVSQLSVMLRAAARPEERAEPVRIGFRLAAELEDEIKA